MANVLPLMHVSINQIEIRCGNVGLNLLMAPGDAKTPFCAFAHQVFRCSISEKMRCLGLTDAGTLKVTQKTCPEQKIAPAEQIWNIFQSGRRNHSETFLDNLCFGGIHGL